MSAAAHLLARLGCKQACTSECHESGGKHLLQAELHWLWLICMHAGCIFGLILCVPNTSMRRFKHLVCDILSLTMRADTEPRMTQKLYQQASLHWPIQTWSARLASVVLIWDP